MIRSVAPQESTRTLGAIVRARREALGLTVAEAATKAGISRGTWINLEKDARNTQPHNYAGIENALRWTPGSINLIREGHPPSELPQDPNGLIEEAIRSIRNNPNRSEPLRRWAAAVLDQIGQLKDADRLEGRERGEHVG